LLDISAADGSRHVEPPVVALFSGHGDILSVMPYKRQ
jgi:hypothetical protein